VEEAVANAEKGVEKASYERAQTLEEALPQAWQGQGQGQGQRQGQDWRQRLGFRGRFVFS
jgi:hypothetical protein